MTTKTLASRFCFKRALYDARQIQRIIRRMALKSTSTTATACVFAIEHSSDYSTLTVHTLNGKVLSYSLH